MLSLGQHRATAYVARQPLVINDRCINASTPDFLTKLVSGEYKEGGVEAFKLLWDRFNVV